MFTVKPEYWSCMGETVLKKTKFDQDSAIVRGLNRILLDQQAADSMSQTRIQPPQPPPLPIRMIAALLVPVQQLAQTVLIRPAQALMNFVLLLPQTLAQTGAQLGQAMSRLADRTIGQLLSFFFGYKKDKTEETEQRDRNDASLLDIFGDNPFTSSRISQKENAGFGSGSK